MQVRCFFDPKNSVLKFLVILFFIRITCVFWSSALFSYFSLTRVAFFLLLEFMLSFVFTNKSSIFSKDKNLGNKHVITQEETFSFLRENDFYTIILFLSYVKLKLNLVLNKFRFLNNELICSSLSKNLDKKSFTELGIILKQILSLKTLFVSKNKLIFN